MPSSCFKPEVKTSGGVYEDIPLAYPPKNDPSDSHLLLEEPGADEILLEIKLDIATGVPIPDEKGPNKIEREFLKYREVYVSLYNQNKGSFISNTCRIPALWDPEYEDRWYFYDKMKPQR